MHSDAFALHGVNAILKVSWLVFHYWRRAAWVRWLKRVVSPLCWEQSIRSLMTIGWSESFAWEAGPASGVCFEQGTFTWESRRNLQGAMFDGRTLIPD